MIWYDCKINPPKKEGSYILSYIFHNNLVGWEKAYYYPIKNQWKLMDNTCFPIYENQHIYKWAEIDLPKTNNDYVFFYGGPFSQWYNCWFEIDKIKYNCAEQYMMASKARCFKDVETLAKILRSLSPETQKKLGRRVKNYNEEIWDKVRYYFVVKGNYAKFSQNKELKEALLSTENKILVEASPYDCIWGIGLSLENPDKFDESKWRGTNLLGKALMEVREKIKIEELINERK